MTISEDITGFTEGDVREHVDQMITALYWFSENGDFLDKDSPSYRMPNRLSELEVVRLHGCLSIACKLLGIEWRSN